MIRYPSGFIFKHDDKCPLEPKQTYSNQNRDVYHQQAKPKINVNKFVIKLGGFGSLSYSICINSLYIFYVDFMLITDFFLKKRRSKFCSVQNFITDSGSKIPERQQCR